MKSFHVIDYILLLVYGTGILIYLRLRARGVNDAK